MQPARPRRSNASDAPRGIVSLIPFNFFTSKTARLQFELETAATNVEVMVNAARQRGSETPAYSQESNETSG